MITHDMEGFLNVECGIFLALAIYLAVLVLVLEHDPPFVHLLTKEKKR